jgi:hypothetical protein
MQTLSDAWITWRLLAIRDSYSDCDCRRLGGTRRTEDRVPESNTRIVGGA